MSAQIFALIVVVIIFTLLFAWVFWPGNRERFENQGRSIIDTQEPEQGEKS